jgi:hypothetical protein
MRCLAIWLFFSHALVSGEYNVAVFASNGFALGLLSNPVLVRLKSRKVPSSAESTFEFMIGGVRFRRPAEI